jgi:hypothetical protein
MQLTSKKTVIFDFVNGLLWSVQFHKDDSVCMFVLACTYRLLRVCMCLHIEDSSVSIVISYGLDNQGSFYSNLSNTATFVQSVDQ